MITSFFNKELGILEVRYSGRITVKDIEKHGRDIEKDRELPRDLRVLYTIEEDAVYDFAYDEIQYFKEEMRQHLKYYHTWKDALLHTSPRETALSMLVEMDHIFEDQNYERRIFSTRKAALEWLLS